MQTRSSSGSVVSPVAVTRKAADGMRAVPKKAEGLPLDEIEQRLVRQAGRRLLFWQCFREARHLRIIPVCVVHATGAFCFAVGSGFEAAGTQALSFRILIRCRTRVKNPPLVSAWPILTIAASANSWSNTSRIKPRVSLVEVIDGFVEQYPARFVQQQPGEGQLVLVLAGQLPFPARGAIKLRRQIAQVPFAPARRRIPRSRIGMAGEG